MCRTRPRTVVLPQPPRTTISATHLRPMPRPTPLRRSVKRRTVGHLGRPKQTERNKPMSDTIITVVGNLTGDPDMRFTPYGAAVANFTIASTPRTFDKQANEFKDGETLFMRCSIWRVTAENVAESLTKGTRVIAQGRLVQRSFETREGEKRTVVELQVDEIGPSLRYASASVTRTQRGGGGFSGGGGGGFGGGGSRPAANDDPWASDGPSSSSGGSSGSSFDEPPF